MKKTIYSLMAALALVITFTSCGGDDDNTINYSTTPEKATEGTYNGTWSKTLSGSTDTESFPGTVTMTGVSKGVSNVNVSCPEASIDITVVVNIWNSGYDFQFSNNLASSLGTSGIVGKISEKGVLTTSFTISQKVGKKNYEYIYQFLGNK